MVNRSATLWFDAEELLGKTLDFLGLEGTVHDSGYKIVVELSDGRSTFWLYSPNCSDTEMQGSLLAWLMSYEYGE